MLRWISGTVIGPPVHLLIPEWSLIIGGTLAGLVAFHVYGLTDTLALGSKSAIALWLAIGLIAASWNLTHTGAKDD